MPQTTNNCSSPSIELIEKFLGQVGKKGIHLSEFRAKWEEFYGKPVEGVSGLKRWLNQTCPNEIHICEEGYVYSQQDIKFVPVSRDGKIRMEPEAWVREEATWNHKLVQLLKKNNGLLHLQDIAKKWKNHFGEPMNEKTSSVRWWVEKLAPRIVILTDGLMRLDDYDWNPLDLLSGKISDDSLTSAASDATSENSSQRAVTEKAPSQDATPPRGTCGIPKQAFDEAKSDRRVQDGNASTYLTASSSRWQRLPRRDAPRWPPPPPSAAAASPKELHRNSSRVKNDDVPPPSGAAAAATPKEADNSSSACSASRVKSDVLPARKEFPCPENIPIPRFFENAQKMTARFKAPPPCILASLSKRTSSSVKADPQSQRTASSDQPVPAQSAPPAVPSSQPAPAPVPSSDPSPVPSQEHQALRNQLGSLPERAESRVSTSASVPSTSAPATEARPSRGRELASQPKAHSLLPPPPLHAPPSIKAKACPPNFPKTILNRRGQQDEDQGSATGRGSRISNSRSKDQQQQEQGSAVTAVSKISNSRSKDQQQEKGGASQAATRKGAASQAAAEGRSSARDDALYYKDRGATKGEKGLASRSSGTRNDAGTASAGAGETATATATAPSGPNKSDVSQDVWEWLNGNHSRDDKAPSACSEGRLSKDNDDADADDERETRGLVEGGGIKYRNVGRAFLLSASAASRGQTRIR